MKICPSCGKEWPDDFLLCPADGSSLRTSSAGSGDLVDSIIADRYHIKQKLGQGGMGTVYLAEHVKMGQQAAIKVISRALASDPAAIARFTREARNAASIRHPNVCTIHDFGETADGLIYMAMEFIEGESLADLLKREGRLAPPRAAAILLQCCDALQAAHDLDIVHRDIKPENIMITKTRDGGDVVKVVDFGIAKAVAGETGQTVTQTGFIVGTPDYMSPDQVSGQILDGRSDIYSLAVVFFRMVTGALPFQSTTPQEALLARMAGTPAKLRETLPTAGFPPQLEEVLDRALAQRREDRYGTAMDFGRAVMQAVQGAPTMVSSASWEAAETRVLDTPQPTPAPSAGALRSATPETPHPTPSPVRSRTGPRIAAAVGAVVIVGGLVAVWQLSGSGGTDAEEGDTTAVAAVLAGDSAKPADSAGAADADKADTVATGTIVISGLPRGGRVIAQGRELEPPFVLPAGRHDVELQAPGYENKTVTIDVVAGERMTVVYAARLVEERRAPAPQPRAEVTDRGRSLTLGQRVTGALTSASPAMGGRHLEAWTFRGSAGQQVEITLRSDDFDSFLYLRGPGLAEPLENDDGAGNLHSLIRTSLPASGSYTILASTLGEGAVGSYTLSLTAPVDLATLPISGRQVSMGDVVSGTLSGSEPTFDGRLVQAWALNARAGTRVEITMRSADFDAYLFLTGPGLSEPLRDDDGGGGRDARIRTTLAQGGTYRVVASQYGASGAGAYTLSVTAPGELDLPTAGRRLAIGRSATGQLGTSETPFQNRQVQAWELRVPSSQRVDITLRSDAFDPFLYLAGPGLEETLSNDDGADGNNAQITALLPAGRYLVMAAAFSAGTGGPYTLAARAAASLDQLPRSGRRLSTSTAVTGTLTTSDPLYDGRHVQVFELRGSPGTQVQITLRSETFDTYLYLLGPGIDEPITDDDGAGGTNSRIATRLGRGGTYLVVVGGYNESAVGAFTLSVSGQ